MGLRRDRAGLHPDGGNVIFTGPKLLIHNAAGNTWSGVTGGELTNVSGAVAAAVAADGTVVYHYGTAVYRVRSGTAVTKLIDPGPIRGAPGTDGLMPVFSPDGSKLVFVRMAQAGHHLWLADADGSNQVQPTTEADTGGVVKQQAGRTDR